MAGPKRRKRVRKDAPSRGPVRKTGRAAPPETKVRKAWDDFKAKRDGRPEAPRGEAAPRSVPPKRERPPHRRWEEKGRGAPSPHEKLPRPVLVERAKQRHALPMDLVKRERRVKSLSPTSPHHGKAPSERSVEELLASGVVVLDKPAGPTSHQVAAWVKRILDKEKVGHGGTLDPNVTGVLPICVGEATRAVGTLLSAGKEYVALMRLHAEVPEAVIRGRAREMVGEVTQLPPVRSAVARRLRQREVYYLEVLEIDGRDVLFRVGCEAGTYIRALCSDWGRAMEVGAHMQELRRTRSGPFREAQSVSLHDLADAVAFWRQGDASWLKDMFRPVEDLFAHLPRLVVRDSAVDALCHGAPLAVPGVAALDEGVEPGRLCVAETLKGEAVALVRAELATKRVLERDEGIAARMERVLMAKGTYPKRWKKK